MNKWMLMMLAAGTCMAGTMTERSQAINAPAAVQKYNRSSDIAQLKATPEWSSITNNVLQWDLTDWPGLTNDMAAYPADRAAAVTAIAGATNAATTRTAMTALLTLIQDVRTVQVDQKPCLQDAMAVDKGLKRLVMDPTNGTVAIINRMVGGK